MPDPRRPSAEEVRLAQEEKDEQIAQLTRKRQISLVCGVCLLMAAVVMQFSTSQYSRYARHYVAQLRL